MGWFLAGRLLFRNKDQSNKSILSGDRGLGSLFEDVTLLPIFSNDQRGVAFVDVHRF